MKKTFKKIALASLAFMPVIASAQASAGRITNLLGVIRDVMNFIIPLLITAGVIYFVWGVVQYIMNAGDEKAREVGRNKMVYGIIGLFVIVSMWGLVQFVGDTTGIGGGSVNPCEINPLDVNC